MTGVFQGQSQGFGKRGANSGDFSPVDHGCARARYLGELLIAQQTRFGLYLDVLDKQQEAITNGRGEEILFYVELEEQIEKELFSIQKVVLPLEKGYDAAYPADPQQVAITELKAALEVCKNEVLIRSKRNRELLAKQMGELRAQIETLRASPLRRISVYASTGVASCIDIQM
ncbi:MAG: flagellar biosynthesis protein FlgN [Treponema sp.]|jgi:hypothetical protein|nr:flagellar biosynthesis protein FlgN [Treponema sp.]